MWAVSCCCLVLAVAAAQLHGQDAPPKKAKAAPLKLKEDEVKTLAKKMGAPKEADRDDAVKKLTAAGVAVIPDLVEAANKGTNRARDNAIAILEGHLKDENAETRIAAFEGLRKLSDSYRPEVAAAVKRIMKEHKDVREEADAAKLAAKEKKAANPEKKPATPEAKPQPKAAPSTDPLIVMRRQAIEQQIKDGEASIAKIRQLKLPKELEAQQISAVNQALQKLRTQLRELDKPVRKK